MSVKPVLPNQAVIDANQLVSILSTGGGESEKDGLKKAAATFSSFGKMASCIPGVGSAIGAFCSGVSAVLSFIANPSG